MWLFLFFGYDTRNIGNQDEKSSTLRRRMRLSLTVFKRPALGVALILIGCLFGIRGFQLPLQGRVF